MHLVALESHLPEFSRRFSGLENSARKGVTKKKIPEKFTQIFLALVPSEGSGGEREGEKKARVSALSSRNSTGIF